MNKEEAQRLFETRPMMKCGCVAMATYEYKGEHGATCITHDCYEVAEKQPNLKDRKARCTYYGQPVKGGMRNSNCCSKCNVGDVCRCEEPSSPNLWFFVYRPDEEYDEFYCACHGAD